jgi:hypothetical protein
MHDFDEMDAIEKLQVLAEQSVFLLQREEGCFKISLYQMENFYVEIYFHRTQFSYKNVRVFSNTSELAPYLDAIDISDAYC